MEFLYDFVVAGFSVVDIICDILVAMEFYNHNYMQFFYVSVGIFLVAQVIINLLSFCVFFVCPIILFYANSQLLL